MTEAQRDVVMFTELCNYVQHRLDPELPDDVYITSPQARAVAAEVMGYLDDLTNELGALLNETSPTALPPKRGWRWH